jgi:guanine deaminase
MALEQPAVLAGDADARALCGTIVHAPAYGDLSIHENHILVYSAESGSILALAPAADASQLIAEHGMPEAHVRYLKPSQFLMPGLIDCHVHAPQYEFTGTGRHPGAPGEDRDGGEGQGLWD